MNRNIIGLTDSYKISHYKQYPQGTTNVYSYFESRGGMFGQTVFFGLTSFLYDLSLQEIFLEDSFGIKELDRWQKRFGQHFFGQNLFNREGWEHIINDHHGKLPLRIKAVPEGTVVPNRNVLMTVENTCPKCFWLTNYVETLLVQCWYPITVATISREIKKVILKYLELTGDPSLIDFKLHDFGFRGVSSVQSAGIGGAAHLVNFKGTDTLEAIECVYTNYAPIANDEPMPGFSIPAAEHSTIVSWGRDRECEAYENMLDQYPEGYVAVVSDSYDIYNACENIWGDKLKNKVLSRNGTLVIRPDSGDPSTVICKVLDILWKKFGGTVNNKGYKVLDSHVRVIQGDGVDYFSIREILANMEKIGFSADNIAFGMGGALLQKLNRDTQQFAFKCSSVVINNETHSVSKSPVGDVSKKSKEGRLKLVKLSDQSFVTVSEDQLPNEPDILQTVFENGDIKVYPSFSEIRERAKITKVGDL